MKLEAVVGVVGVLLATAFLLVLVVVGPYLFFVLSVNLKMHSLESDCQARRFTPHLPADPTRELSQVGVRLTARLVNLGATGGDVWSSQRYCRIEGEVEVSVTRGQETLSIHHYKYLDGTNAIEDKDLYLAPTFAALLDGYEVVSSGQLIFIQQRQPTGGSGSTYVLNPDKGAFPLVSLNAGESWTEIDLSYEHVGRDHYFQVSNQQSYIGSINPADPTGERIVVDFVSTWNSQLHWTYAFRRVDVRYLLEGPAA